MSKPDVGAFLSQFQSDTSIEKANEMNADPKWHNGMLCDCGHNLGFHFTCAYDTPCQFPGCACLGWNKPQGSVQ